MTMEPIASTIESMILREAKRTDLQAPVISFDPNIRPIMIHDRASYGRRMEIWMAHSTIVKISGADMEFVYPDLSRDEAFERVLSLGPRKREDGSRFTATAPVVEVTVADTIGAGDTFHAAFLSWLELHGKMSRSALSALTETELRDALFFANKAASLVCSKHGAEPPTMAEMDALRT
jgi:fructokinase